MSLIRLLQERGAGVPRVYPFMCWQDPYTSHFTLSTIPSIVKGLAHDGAKHVLVRQRS